jgi:hypothetical protein
LLLARRLRQMLLAAVSLSPLDLVRRAARPLLVAGLARLVLAARCLLLRDIRAALERAAAFALSPVMPASPVLVAVSALSLARARVPMAGL